MKIHITTGQLIEQNIRLTNLATATPTTNMNNSTPSKSGGAGQQPVSGSVNTATPTPTPTIVTTSTPKAASTPTPMPKSVIEPSSKIPGADTFNDLKGHWAERDIMQLVENGIISGYPDNSIKPDAEITRAELTAIIVKAAGLKPIAKPVLKFTDTAQIPDWVKGYLQFAAGKGIISSYFDGSFKAEKQCSRRPLDNTWFVIQSIIYGIFLACVKPKRVYHI